MIEGINLDLNSRELMSILYWMVQGDGGLYRVTKTSNAYFRCMHKKSAMDYILEKASIIRQICGAKVTTQWHSKSLEDFATVTSQSHPKLTQLWERIYQNKRKRLDMHGLKLLDVRSLAFLYMDDGRYNPNKSDISIFKSLWSELECLSFAKQIVDNWGIIFRLRRHTKLKDGSQAYCLGLRYSDKDKFFNLISPYIVPSMSYKIVNGGASKQML